MFLVCVMKVERAREVKQVGRVGGGGGGGGGTSKQTGRDQQNVTDQARDSEKKRMSH